VEFRVVPAQAAEMLDQPEVAVVLRQAISLKVSSPYTSNSFTRSIFWAITYFSMVTPSTEENSLLRCE
jgi:hypothetical protein